MLEAFDTLLQTRVSAKNAAANSDNEAFRYECLCCGEEVFLAAQGSIHKATHFRHRSGNNDKECELYLGQYGMVPYSPLNKNKHQDRVEFYYQHAPKAFYMSFKFSDVEITAYENSGSSIEVRSYRNQNPFFTQKIDHTNFIDDAPERFMLEEYATPYYISNTSNNIKREYHLFGNVGPTFFKIQGEDTDFSAKYIKSKSLYTNVKYFIAWPGQNTAQIRLKKIPDVKIDEMVEFKTMKSCTVWALIATFINKNPQLDELLQSWGYDLNISEELMLLWPPAYESDETLCVSTNNAYAFSSFALQAFGNTNIPSSSIHKVNDYITRIDFRQNLKILKKNAEMSVIETAFLQEENTLEIQSIIKTRFTVPNEGVFYRFSSSGTERLLPGQTIFLTENSCVVEYHGNYKCKIINAPKSKKTTLAEQMQEALMYYNVSVPYDVSIEENCTEGIAKYLNKCKEKGYINKAVKAIIMEGKHE